MNVYLVASAFSGPIEAFETPEGASDRIAQLPDALRSRYQLLTVPVQAGDIGGGRFRFAITYRTDEGIFHVGPAGVLNPGETPPPKAKTVRIYEKQAHILLFTVEADRYDDGLCVANNIAALFAMSDNPYGPEWVDVGGQFWKFDPKRGFLNTESPDA